MSATAVTPREFICPGQHYAISRSVHLARIASGYAACRKCACNDRDLDRVATAQEESASRAESLCPPPSRFQRLFDREGIRGVFRNELTIADVERFATALASTLWEDAEMLGTGVPPRGFPVVVGHDDRPWSMPVAVAAGAALRLAGCETIDVGFVTGPAFRFAVSHLDAHAGMLATGAGGNASIAGLDAVGAVGRPLSVGGGLERLHAAPAGRLTRRAGGRREFDANLPYEANLRKHCQDVVAMSVVVGTASPLLHQRLLRINSEIATSIVPVLLPREGSTSGGPAARAVALIRGHFNTRKGEAPAEPQLRMTTESTLEAQRELRPPGSLPSFETSSMKTMRASGATLGVWIDEDGSAARVFDIRGRLLPVGDVAAELIQEAVHQRPRSTIAVDWTLADQLNERALRGRDIVRSGGTAEAMAITMADHSATIGVDSSGRMWLPGPTVACDALVMLARMLKAFRNSGRL